MDRFDADIDDFFVGWIDRHGAHVAFKDPAPIFTGIIGLIKSILGYAQVNDVGFAAQAVNRIDGAGFERDVNLFPAAVFRMPNKQAFLSPGVYTHWAKP